MSNESAVTTAQTLCGRPSSPLLSPPPSCSPARYLLYLFSPCLHEVQRILTHPSAIPVDFSFTSQHSRASAFIVSPTPMALYLSAVLALGAVLAPAPAAAYTPSVMFNYTVLDTSPMLSFTSDTGGWNTTFSNSPSYVPGMLGEGDSSHVIAGSSPDLNFDFVGTGVYIYGSATEVVQDGDIGLLIVDQKATSKATAGPGIIASVTGLEYGLHHINFRGLGGTWTITQVDLTMGVQTGE